MNVFDLLQRKQGKQSESEEAPQTDALAATELQDPLLQTQNLTSTDVEGGETGGGGPPPPSGGPGGAAGAPGGSPGLNPQAPGGLGGPNLGLGGFSLGGMGGLLGGGLDELRDGLTQATSSLNETLAEQEAVASLSPLANALVRNGWRSRAAAEAMGPQDLRNTLIVELERQGLGSIAELQGRDDESLAAMAGGSHWQGVQDNSEARAEGSQLSALRPKARLEAATRQFAVWEQEKRPLRALAEARLEEAKAEIASIGIVQEDERRARVRPAAARLFGLWDSQVLRAREQINAKAKAYLKSAGVDELPLTADVPTLAARQAYQQARQRFFESDGPARYFAEIGQRDRGPWQSIDDIRGLKGTPEAIDWVGRFAGADASLSSADSGSLGSASEAADGKNRDRITRMSDAESIGLDLGAASLSLFDDLDIFDPFRVYVARVVRAADLAPGESFKMSAAADVEAGSISIEAELSCEDGGQLTLASNVKAEIAPIPEIGVYSEVVGSNGEELGDRLALSIHAGYFAQADFDDPGSSEGMQAEALLEAGKLASAIPGAMAEAVLEVLNGPLESLGLDGLVAKVQEILGPIPDPLGTLQNAATSQLGVDPTQLMMRLNVIDAKLASVEEQIPFTLTLDPTNGPHKRMLEAARDAGVPGAGVATEALEAVGEFFSDAVDFITGGNAPPPVRIKMLSLQPLRDALQLDAIQAATTDALGLPAWDMVERVFQAAENQDVRYLLFDQSKLDDTIQTLESGDDVKVGLSAGKSADAEVSIEVDDDTQQQMEAAQEAQAATGVDAGAEEASSFGSRSAEASVAAEGRVMAGLDLSDGGAELDTRSAETSVALSVDVSAQEFDMGGVVTVKFSGMEFAGLELELTGSTEASGVVQDDLALLSDFAGVLLGITREVGQLINSSNQLLAPLYEAAEKLELPASGMVSAVRALSSSFESYSSWLAEASQELGIDTGITPQRLLETAVQGDGGLANAQALADKSQSADFGSAMSQGASMQRSSMDAQHAGGGRAPSAQAALSGDSGAVQDQMSQAAQESLAASADYQDLMQLVLSSSVDATGTSSLGATLNRSYSLNLQGTDGGEAQMETSSTLFRTKTVNGQIELDVPEISGPSPGTGGSSSVAESIAKLPSSVSGLFS